MAKARVYADDCTTWRQHSCLFSEWNFINKHYFGGRQRKKPHSHTRALKAMIINIKWWFGQKKSHEKRIDIVLMTFVTFDYKYSVICIPIDMWKRRAAPNYTMNERKERNGNKNKRKTSIYYRWRSINIWLTATIAPIHTFHANKCRTWMEHDVYRVWQIQRIFINVRLFHVF